MKLLFYDIIIGVLEGCEMGRSTKKPCGQLVEQEFLLKLHCKSSSSSFKGMVCHGFIGFN
jgi:hypothetical protein